MQKHLKILSMAAVMATLIIGAYLLLQNQPVTPPVPAKEVAQVVKTVRAEQKPVEVTLEANGYVTALNSVEVRPQTQNIVRTVHVREGQDVRAGELLFTLDQRSDQSNVARAKAEVARSRAELAEAEMALKRNRELLEKNFVSQAMVDTARNKVEGLRSTVQASEAAIESSVVALGNNRITAAISGRIGAINVRQGSLAQPSGDPMLTISQLDPIAVSFSLPERQLSVISTTYPEGNAPVEALVPGGKTMNGKLFFIDNMADPQSGTIRMKAQFPNEERKLWPGTFVTVQMVSRILKNAVVVPAQAVVTGPTEKFVYVVQQDDTVRQQPVDVVSIERGKAALAGLEAGTRVVMEGTQNLRPGGKIREASAMSAPEEEARPAA